MGQATGTAAYIELVKKQFKPQKFLYHILFWTFHWGIFAYGWYGTHPAETIGIGH